MDQINSDDLNVVALLGSKPRRFPQGKAFFLDPEILYQGQRQNPRRRPKGLDQGLARPINPEFDSEQPVKES